MRFRRQAPLSVAPVRPGQPLFIKELINRVHDELLQSRQERELRGEAAVFEVENLTLEVNFVAQRTTEFDGGLDLKIVTVGGTRIGGKHSYQDQQVHKITLTLAAIPYQAGDESEGSLLDLEHTPRFRPNED